MKGIVIRTGYSTSKGRLVRSIMYPKPIDFAFTRDTLKFVGFLSLVSLIGFVYAAILMILRNRNISNILIKSFDIVTIVVPPFLPVAMTVGKFYFIFERKFRFIENCFLKESLPQNDD